MWVACVSIVMGCAQPAGRASRDLQAEDWHVRCGHARAVCGERCGWHSATGRHFAVGIDRYTVAQIDSRSPRFQNQAQRMWAG